jgi:hypothetical protein
MVDPSGTFWKAGPFTLRLRNLVDPSYSITRAAALEKPTALQSRSA